jgi:hypothetical protein
VELALPAFLTIALMPFTYSITNGIGASFVTYAALKLLRGKAAEVRPTMWIAAAAFVVYFGIHYVRRLLGVPGERPWVMRAHAPRARRAASVPASASVPRIAELLAAFKMPTLAAGLVRRGEAGHSDVLPLVQELLEQEAGDRHERRVERLRRASKLPPGKTFATLKEARLPRRRRAAAGQSVGRPPPQRPPRSSGARDHRPQPLCLRSRDDLLIGGPEPHGAAAVPDSQCRCELHRVVPSQGMAHNEIGHPAQHRGPNLDDGETSEIFFDAGEDGGALRLRDDPQVPCPRHGREQLRIGDARHRDVTATEQGSHGR